MPKGRRQAPKVSQPSREVDTAFGERLRDAMHWRRVGVNDFAAQVKVHPVTVSKWRKGQRPADHLTARVADLLGVRFNWLNSAEGPMVEGEGPPISDGNRIEPQRGTGESLIVRPREELLAAVESEVHTLQPVIPSDPAKRTSVERLWAQFNASIAVRQHEGGELSTSLVQNWLNLMLEKHQIERKELEARIAELERRLPGFQEPPDGD